MMPLSCEALDVAPAAMSTHIQERFDWVVWTNFVISCKNNLLTGTPDTTLSKISQQHKECIQSHYLKRVLAVCLDLPYASICCMFKVVLHFILNKGEPLLRWLAHSDLDLNLKTKNKQTLMRILVQLCSCHISKIIAMLIAITEILAFSLYGIDFKCNVHSYTQATMSLLSPDTNIRSICTTWEQCETTYQPIMYIVG